MADAVDREDVRQLVDAAHVRAVAMTRYLMSTRLDRTNPGDRCDHAVSQPAATDCHLDCSELHRCQRCRVRLIMAHADCDHSAMHSRCTTPERVNTYWLETAQLNGIPP